MSFPAITTDQMAKIDQKVPEKYGITASRMMENAAYQIAEFIRANHSQNDRIAVYAGKGNNGGDGIAAARRLHNWGYSVEVVCPFELNGIRQEELEIIRNLGISISEEPVEADIAVDALIGYNLKGDPRPPFDQLIDAVNKADEIVSVDVPTGVDADAGEGMNPHVEADRVVTLGLPKEGLKDINAEVWVADISVPDEAYSEILGVDVDGLFSEKSLVKMD